MGKKHVMEESHSGSQDTAHVNRVLRAQDKAVRKVGKTSSALREACRRALGRNKVYFVVSDIPTMKRTLDLLHENHMVDFQRVVSSIHESGSTITVSFRGTYGQLRIVTLAHYSQLTGAHHHTHVYDHSALAHGTNWKE